MSLRTAINWVRRMEREAKIEARADDLTTAALVQDVSRARERAARLRHLLALAEEALKQRAWELEVYAAHGTAPKRKGLAKRVAEMAAAARRRAIGPGHTPPAGET